MTPIRHPSLPSHTHPSMTQVSANDKAAVLHFGDGEFLVMSPGTHVRCAVTGEAVPLSRLRYWSVEAQEAYLGPLQYLQAKGVVTG